ncbi:heparan-alpha-glucosaminide N-acetyltransferase domain-containing protein [Nocardioides gansuensis]|uniref:heparan-alpha-glucosaminide N-acetyltransferase domain-containing protein n=1 Tax=Nocardioides gansuensis TaxID=2138300 RepID=UPI001402473E|nr:heparan-alpha-glucosaminide N-acetyltransferase domain-containing protein [Nocardioides gansuensis]
MPGAGRIVGLDVARCLALLGMVASHVFDEPTPADGRASALFAVLAGVTLALSSGGPRPTPASRRAGVAAGLAVRAVLIALVGLVLGGLGSGLAVILTYYGLLFLVGLAFLPLRASALLVLGAVTVVVGPVLSHLVRPHLPERGFASPTLGQLVGDPAGLVSELLFTGYYPVVPWLAYLLVGMGLGRLGLSSRRTPLLLAGAGAVLAVAATVVSRALTGDRVAGRRLEEVEGLPGTTPTGGPWEWLLVAEPHSGTPFDLAQTTGSALLVIGLALLVVGPLGARGTRFVSVLFGAGTMTLTLYSLHVVTRAPGLLPGSLVESYLFHVLLLMGIGSVYVALGRRGPLERLVGVASRSTSRALG